MKKLTVKHIIPTLYALALSLASCGPEEGTIQVQSKIHNVTMQQISWGDHPIYENLGPGQTSDKLTIRDKKDHWPKKHQLEFYLTANGNKVYLKTRAKYELDYDDNLLIVITDTSSVYNPILE